MAGEEDAEATKERTIDDEGSAEDVDATEERTESGDRSDDTPSESEASASVEDSQATEDADQQADDQSAAESDADETASESEGGGVASQAKAELDEAAEAFVEMEENIGHPGDRAIRAHAIDVEKVSAAEVPDDFPYEITTDDALALTLELVESRNRTVTTYFNWPDEAADRRLATLLELTDVSVDRFADLHGKEILLEVQDAHYVPMLPAAGPRGDDRAIYGILAGIAPSLLIALFSFVGYGAVLASMTFVLLWLICTFVVLPVSIYLDAWHLRTRTDWDGGPLFWAFLSMIPFLNVLVVPAYLISRENSHPLA